VRPLPFARVEVRRLSAEDAPLLREVRLLALRDAPYAFSSWYEREIAFDDGVWAGRAAESDTGVVFVALERGRPVGMAGGHYRDGQPDVPEVWGVWVAPQARRRGLAGELVERVADGARENGARRLSTAVADAGAARPAAELYRALGFAGSGEREPLRPDSSAEAITMYRPL